MDLSLDLDGTHVLITGGNSTVGSITVSAFLTAGALVTALDTKASPLPAHENLQSITCDITSESEIEDAFKQASMMFGVVKCCVSMAGLDTSSTPTPTTSLADTPLSKFQSSHTDASTGTFLTARAWLRQLRTFVTAFSKPASDLHKCTFTNVCMIIVGEAGETELVETLAADVVRIWARGRINAVVPGRVDTEEWRKECASDNGLLWVDSQATTALKVPVPPESVAKSILFLASENWSGHVSGQVLNVDAGRQRRVLWKQEECKKTIYDV